MDKVAVYAGGPSVYPEMVTTAKSLVANSSVDRVYLLVEGAFPYELPDLFRVIDVLSAEGRPQGYPSGPAGPTHVTVPRAAYAALMPGEESVLHIDVDTFCVSGVDGAWDVDVTGRWFAAVDEVNSRYKPYGDVYLNDGVMLMNLLQMRMDGADELFLADLARGSIAGGEQAVMNKYALPMRKAVPLPVRYNEFWATGETDDPAIVHWAHELDWKRNMSLRYREEMEEYRHMPWSEVLKRRSRHADSAGSSFDIGRSFA